MEGHAGAERLARLDLDGDAKRRDLPASANIDVAVLAEVILLIDGLVDPSGGLEQRTRSVHTRESCYSRLRQLGHRTRFYVRPLAGVELTTLVVHVCQSTWRRFSVTEKRSAGPRSYDSSAWGRRLSILGIRRAPAFTLASLESGHTPHLPKHFRSEDYGREARQIG